MSKDLWKCKECNVILTGHRMDNHNNIHNKSKEKEGWKFKCQCEDCKNSNDRYEFVLKCTICKDGVYRSAECDTLHFYEKHTKYLEGGWSR